MLFQYLLKLYKQIVVDFFGGQFMFLTLKTCIHIEQQYLQHAIDSAMLLRYLKIKLIQL